MSDASARTELTRSVISVQNLLFGARAESVVEKVGELVVLETPAGVNEEVGGCLGDEALYGDRGVKAIDYIAAEGDVFVDCKAWNINLTTLYLTGEHGVSDELQLMKFDGVGEDFIYCVDGLQHHLCCFSGKAENEVETYIYAAGFRHGYGIDGALPGVATIDKPQCHVMGAFGSVLDDNTVITVDFGEGIEETQGDAVGTCAYYYGIDTVDSQGFTVEG